MEKSNKSLSFIFFLLGLLSSTFFLSIINIAYVSLVMNSCTSPQEVFLILLFSTILLALCAYIIIYVIWRKIEPSLSSFIWFLVFIIQFVLYMYGFYLIFVYGLEKPIHVEDISILSHYPTIVIYSS